MKLVFLTLLIFCQFSLAGSLFCHQIHHSASVTTELELRDRAEILALAMLRLGSGEVLELSSRNSLQSFIAREVELIRKQWPSFDQEFREIYLLAAPKYFESRQERENLARTLEDERRKREEQTHKQVIESDQKLIDGTRAIFHRVKALPEIMATPMTQSVYRTVAELANKRFPKKYKIEPDPSYFKGDSRPVESVSHKDAKVWTKALNDLLSINEPGITNLFPGHVPGMRYEAFLTAEQWDYLFNNALTEDNRMISEILRLQEIETLKKYFAFGKARPQGTIDVDQLKPLLIEGHQFYGLSGNVGEWLKDRVPARRTHKGSRPSNSRKLQPLVRMGSWPVLEEHFLKNLYIDFEPDYSADNLGFRLVRFSGR